MKKLAFAVVALLLTAPLAHAAGAAEPPGHGAAAAAKPEAPPAPAEHAVHLSDQDLAVIGRALQRGYGVLEEQLAVKIQREIQDSQKK